MECKAVEMLPSAPLCPATNALGCQLVRHGPRDEGGNQTPRVDHSSHCEGLDELTRTVSVTACRAASHSSSFAPTAKPALRLVTLVGAFHLGTEFGAAHGMWRVVRRPLHGLQGRRLGANFPLWDEIGIFARHWRFESATREPVPSGMGDVDLRFNPCLCTCHSRHGQVWVRPGR